MKLRTRPVSATPLAVASPPRRARAFAHRGASCMAPENTMLAFRLAIEAGVDGIETDARLTADGEIVLLHDADLARTTDGAGDVGTWRLAELRALDAGYRFAAPGAAGRPFRGLGVGIATLTELVVLLDRIAPRVALNVELKTTAGVDGATERLADAVVDELRRLGALERALISSFEPAAIERARSRPGRPPTAYLAGPDEDLARALAYARVAGHAALHPHHALLDAPGGMEALAAARAAGIEVNVWTVNDAARMREFVARGVDGVMSDDPQRLCAVLDRDAELAAQG